MFYVHHIILSIKFSTITCFREKHKILCYFSQLNKIPSCFTTLFITRFCCHAYCAATSFLLLQNSPHNFHLHKNQVNCKMCDSFLKFEHIENKLKETIKSLKNINLDAVKKQF